MPVWAVERKLAAILAADVAGYSRLMGTDEVGTLQRLTAYRVIVDGLIATHRGRIFHTAGDSVVADFASAVDAAECALAVQEVLAGENVNQPAAEQMQFRIGVHIGDNEVAAILARPAVAGQGRCAILRRREVFS
jgi:adenylate cyclase